ncbi:hypothetical protein CANCADRAFT_81064 [Tortispora caseinolytica NRRL Y-17796]|uniref:Eukaryotic translation initiation factor 3 subunit I n=1 Tax=Tortispora caseinolytica NRRL Y-17796 TaxID=767744 RepID=A0A1E4TK21_9ASCO|nr:hypothetical protein CANCADRAFT_81064 [Tortispora caseinolytica NRRL Y-17796]
MRPIMLKGHSRPLTQIKYNREGDLLFSVGKDGIVGVWYSHNGERLGTYDGQMPTALWTVDPHPESNIALSGGADNEVHVWKVNGGELIHRFQFETTVKQARFSPDGKQLFAIIEQRMGCIGQTVVFDVPEDLESFSDEPRFLLEFDPKERAKVTTAGWGYDPETGIVLILAHDDGWVTKVDSNDGSIIESLQIHDKPGTITDIQFSTDHTYFITSSKDKTAKLLDVKTLNVLKTYRGEAGINTAAITPVKDFVVLGGGQEARDVTTTSNRQGNFESRFYHKIFEDPIGRVTGHFGPINTLAVHPDGTQFASGSEDGYIRVHNFDKPYFDFLYDVEREAIAASKH